MTYSHEAGCHYADPYPSATPAMSLEMQRLDREIAAWRGAHPGATEADYWRAMEPCPICDGTGEVEDEEGFWTDCPCRDTQPDADAIMDAALDERFALPAWEDARDREREAMPPVLDGVAF